MFKYLALAIDYFLIVCYYASTPTLNFTIFIVVLPPIFHTLAFLVKPHCYQSHCKPMHPKGIIPMNSTTSNKNLEYATPMRMNSRELESPSPSPSPFSANDEKTQSKEQGKNKINKKENKNILEHEYQQCIECGLIKWVRMHHCYYCHTCVHKYDHHCVLLGICIGEANQKYYLPFLWALLCSSIVQVYDYYGLIENYLWVDERGYEHTQWQYQSMSLAIIFFVVSTVIVGYLAIYHTYLGFHNDTTYEMRKRPDIYYFKGIIDPHPFDKGIINNLKMMIATTAQNPIQWQRPQKPFIQGLRDYRSDKNIFDNEDDVPKYPDNTNF